MKHRKQGYVNQCIVTRSFSRTPLSVGQAVVAKDLTPPEQPQTKQASQSAVTRSRRSSTENHQQSSSNQRRNAHPLAETQARPYPLKDPQHQRDSRRENKDSKKGRRKRQTRPKRKEEATVAAAENPAHKLQPEQKEKPPTRTRATSAPLKNP